MKQRHTAKTRGCEGRQFLFGCKAFQYHAGKSLAHRRQEVSIERRERIGAVAGSWQFFRLGNRQDFQKKVRELHNAIVRSPRMPVARPHGEAEPRIEFAGFIQILHGMNDVVEAPRHDPPGGCVFSFPRRAGI